MIRRCAVFGCDNTDENTIGHRFPDNKEQAQDWKDSLKLNEFPVKLLQTKFIVCKEHFSSRDYKNDRELSATAVPKDERYEKLQQEGLAGNATDSESIEIVSCSSATMCPYNRQPTMIGDSYLVCNTPYNHGDVCVLEQHRPLYEIQHRRASEQSCDLIQSVDAQDFTLLNVDDECKNSCPLEESTEVISPCRLKKLSHALSGTDSEVEVLTSDEIIISDWSANNGEFVAISSTQSAENIGNENEDSARKSNISTSEACEILECTEHDCTGEDVSLLSMDTYEFMTRAQLIRVIKDQIATMRCMKATLKRYREAQKALFVHVDALRMEFEKVNDGQSGGDTFSGDI